MLLLQNLRARMNARLSGDREAGFTLIELLVVMLILGILAAIAIPAFFNQRNKATDYDAKALARTAQTAIETYATDNQGSYEGATPTILEEIEPVLEDATNLTVENDTATGYEVSTESTADSGNVFAIIRTGGTTELECDEPNVDGCPGDSDGDGRGNWGE
jgi:type IV pilus assembly protein PilA